MDESLNTIRKPPAVHGGLAVVAVIATITALVLAASGNDYTRVNAAGPTLRTLVLGADAGTPTVVFESGAGGPLESWVRVQPEVSKFARTFSYDRAGNGLSTKGPTPRDGKSIAAELHAALRASGMSPPYILVGHSLGGPYIRVFAGLYPNEVAGLVLVDPTQEELIEWSKTRKGEPAESQPLKPENEVDCAPATFLQAKENPPPEVPIVLISGQGPKVIPSFVDEEMKRTVQENQDEIYPVKLTFYKEWLRQYPRGEMIITSNSGHGIPYEEPELVTETIRRLLHRREPRTL